MMNTLRFSALSFLAAALTPLPLAGAVPAIAQDCPVAARQSGPETKTATPSNYLVTVGKHVMWRSQVETMHPELKKKAVPVSKASQNDFPVTVGKRTVLASTLRRDPNAAPRPAAHDKACKDYVVQAGKQTVWASSAHCPMGRHEGGTKPLCCLAPAAATNAVAKLPRCCQDAQKGH